MKLMRTLVGGAALSLVVLVLATPAAAGDPQPDGRVRLKGQPFYIGQGVINTSGDNQTVAVFREQGTAAKFEFRFKNVDSQEDDFVVTGCTSEEFREKYFVNGRDITAKVIGEGKKFRDVAPGESTPIVLAKITVRNSTPDGTSSGQQCVRGEAFTNSALADEPAWQIGVPIPI
jgi:hypothetical protein